MKKAIDIIPCKDGEIKVHTSYTHMLDPKGLIPHPDNNNIHSQEQVEATKAVLKANGWRERVVISEKTQKIISGHLRVMTAIEMGMDKIPVDSQQFDSRLDEVRHLTAANELARHAEFDKDIFKKTKKSLKSELDKNQMKLAFMNPRDFGMTAWPKEDEEEKGKNAKLAIQSLLREGDVWLLGDVHTLTLGQTNPLHEDHLQKFLRKFHGKPATLQSTGQTFDEVMDERRNDEQG